MTEQEIRSRFQALANELDVSLVDVMTDALNWVESQYKGAGNRTQELGTGTPSEAEITAFERSASNGERKARFLRLFLQTHVTSRVSGRMNQSPGLFYQWVDRDPEFARLLRRCGWRPRKG